MPYDRITELPEPLRRHLPRAAQELYRKVFNNAWNEYAAQEDRETVAHKVAWTAVKNQYVKRGVRWVRK